MLDQEYRKYVLRQASGARQAKYTASNSDGQPSKFQDMNKENETINQDFNKHKNAGTKRDFFGRFINESRPNALDSNKDGGETAEKESLISGSDHVVNNVWVTFHEGFSNAVRKPITLEELMRGI